jgi:hypothetical protein
MSELSEKLVQTTTTYLGDRADSFRKRQCSYHVKVEPESLTKEHLSELARWVGISAGLVMDKDKADALKKEILSL